MTDNLPATQDPTAALVLPTENEWADVDAGFVGEAPPSAAPVVPRLLFNAKAGQGFTDELTGHKVGEGESLDAIWLAWQESRAFWKEAFGQGDAAPTCRSDNMLVPNENVPEKQSDFCASCPMSQWVDGKPPRCGVKISAMLYLPEEQRITRTSFGGLAMKHVQRYLGGFQTRLPARPPMAFVTEIGVAVEKTSNGDFLVPNFRVARDVSREEATPLIQLRDQLRKQWQELAHEDLNERDDSTKGGGKGEDPFTDTPAPTDADVIDVESAEVNYDDF